VQLVGQHDDIGLALVKTALGDGRRQLGEPRRVVAVGLVGAHGSTVRIDIHSVQR